MTLATPSTTDERCLPLITGGTLSCWDGERAMLNAVRWYNGAEAYGADIDTYRIYLMNHEVGHRPAAVTRTVHAPARSPP